MYRSVQTFWSENYEQFCYSSGDYFHRFSNTFSLVPDQVNQYHQQTLENMTKYTECTNMQDSTCTNKTWCVMSSVATQNICVYMPHPNQITKEVLCDTSSIGLGLYIHALKGLWGKCSFSLKYTDTDSCYFNPLYTEFHFLKFCGYFHISTSAVS